MSSFCKTFSLQTLPTTSLPIATHPHPSSPPCYHSTLPSLPAPLCLTLTPHTNQPFTSLSIFFSLSFPLSFLSLSLFRDGARPVPPGFGRGDPFDSNIRSFCLTLLIRRRPWAPPLGLPCEARGKGRAREGEEKGRGEEGRGRRMYY